jgi:hypothetical protein
VWFAVFGLMKSGVLFENQVAVRDIFIVTGFSIGLNSRSIEF